MVVGKSKFVRDIFNREAKAIELLINLYKKPVYQAAFFITNDHALAEDITQETFIRAIEKIDQLQDHERIAAWLTRISLNLAKTAMKRRAKNVLVDSIESVYSSNNTHLKTPEDYLEQRENKEIVWSAIRKLSVKQRELVFLKYYRELSEENIARYLDIPLGTVKSRLFRVRQLIRQYLTGELFASVESRKIKKYSRIKQTDSNKIEAEEGEPCEQR